MEMTSFTINRPNIVLATAKNRQKDGMGWKILPMKNLKSLAAYMVRRAVCQDYTFRQSVKSQVQRPRPFKASYSDRSAAPKIEEIPPFGISKMRSFGGVYASLSGRLKFRFCAA